MGPRDRLGSWMRSGPRGHVGEQSGWEGGPTTQHLPEQVLLNLCKRKKRGREGGEEKVEASCTGAQLEKGKQ